jgi:hypothetical protein
VPKDSNKRWSFDFDDLAAVAGAAGFSAFRMNRSVYVLSRSAPARPDLLSIVRHALRRAGMLPGQIARNGPQQLSRIVRQSIKKR